jgi:hypothetical protein
MVKVISNSLGSGDWVKTLKNDEVIFEGHRIGPMDLAEMLHRHFNIGVKYDEVTDDEMEEI